MAVSPGIGPAFKSPTLSTAAIAAITLALAGNAAAQSYPDRIIEMIVPSTPGGGTDLATRIVAAKLAKRCEVQLSYAIGYPDPLNIWVNTEGTIAPGVTEAKLVELIRAHFKLTPKGIIETLDLRRPIYKETARHGHFGRELPTFSWEKTDKAAVLKKAAGV